jgi:hypothetical protein
MTTRAEARSNLVNAVRRIVDALEGGDPISESIKTEAYYNRVLDRNIRQLYAGKMSEREFTDSLVDVIDAQFDRAWNEGMRDNGLDPAKDMTDEWAKILDERKVQELPYIEGFASDIAAAGKAGDPLDPLFTRADIWSGRYNEVVDLARVTTRPDDRFKWVYGDTEHCTDCERLNGIVATGKDWGESGWAPQSQDLECHGFNCQCRLEPTDDPLTPGGIPE